jgi:hypothetical protein
MDPEAPSEASPGGSPSGSLAAGQSDTDWGRIWDSVPAGFPRFPGSTPADDAAADPVSARFAVPGGDPRAIATWLQDALEQAHLDTVGLNGPAEDGSFVLDSVGDGPVPGPDDGRATRRYDVHRRALRQRLPRYPDVTES